MCLYVDERYHTTLEPKTAKFPILVYKSLEYSDYHMGYISPYMGIEYEFGVKYSSNLIVDDENDSVEDGLHACTTRESAENHCYRSNYGDIFPAIIPVGAMFFIGEKNEIVSTELIVYKNLRALTRVHGKIRKGVCKENV